MLRVVIGTAGHVDHGKTALVKALTGVDTDRLAEERRRGITIELGFAHLALPGGGVAGVVDVPGHERFVRSMAAGAGGLDLVILVVAADEGVMPQTREHLDICRLLGVQRGLVAVTKSEASDARSRLQDEAEKRIGQIRETVHAAKEKGVEGLESVRQTVEERPIASVIGAFSVGMVIGLLLKGRS